MPRFDPEANLQLLERHDVRYVLIGGLAATLHGSPLRTDDAAATPDNLRFRDSSKPKTNRSIPFLRMGTLKLIN